MNFISKSFMTKQLAAIFRRQERRDNRTRREKKMAAITLNWFIKRPRNIHSRLIRYVLYSFWNGTTVQHKIDSY